MRLRLLICFLLLATGSFVQAQESGLRPFAVEDLFRREGLAVTTLSPDGRRMAYVLERSVSGENSRNTTVGSGTARSDIWVFDMDSGRKENITDGQRDGWGYWRPIWSPSGDRLAMLSNREGRTRLWLWDRLTRKFSPVSDSKIKDSPGTIAWVSNESMICITLPDDPDPSGPFAEASRQWSRFVEGRTTSATVYESGETQPHSASKSKIVILNVLSERRTHVDDGVFDMIAMSPDGRYAALRKLGGTFAPIPDERLNLFRPRPYYLIIISSEGRVIFRSKELADRGLPVRPDIQYRWSPDSKVLTGLAREHLGSGDTEWGAYIFRYKVGSESLERLSYKDFVPLDTIWTSDGKLLVKGSRVSGSGDARRQQVGWWAITDSKLGSVQLAERSAGVVDGDGSFFTITDGQIWRIKSNSATREKVSIPIDARVTGFWGSTYFEARSGNNPVVLFRGGKDYYVLDTSTLKTTILEKPSPDAFLVAFSNWSGAAVFRADTKSGTQLWISKTGTEPPIEILKANTFLSDIEETTNWKEINYRSTDGSQLKGWLLLPTGYREGRKYPVVTWVYAGNVYSNSPRGASIASEVRIASPLNLQFLTARGYAVLLPSMPMSPDGVKSDPYADLPKGVLPAVEKVIEIGVADPQRIGVMGFSYGGYSVYSLVTQTNRFQAAVAIAGLTDLISKYLLPDPTLRNTGQEYSDEFPHLVFFKMGLAETGTVRMGDPPWKDPERYMRNSPVLQANRVQTPILLIHGDMDGAVPIENAEEFFTAMYRQGKRARLVRYWGEGHGMESPANIRDMWNHTYFWFDRFLNISRDEKGKMVWLGSEVKPPMETSGPKR